MNMSEKRERKAMRRAASITRFEEGDEAGADGSFRLGASSCRRELGSGVGARPAGGDGGARWALCGAVVCCAPDLVERNQCAVRC